MVPSRLTRSCTAAVIAVVGVVVLLGLALTPVAVLVTLAVIATLLGSGVAMTVHSSSHDTASALRAGVRASATGLSVGLVVAGLVALLGVTAVPALLLLAAVGGGRLRRHLSSRSDRIRRASTGRERTTPAGDGSSGDAPQLVRRAELSEMGLSALHIDAATTPALCSVWQRTYWLLCDLPSTSPRRSAAVGVRGEVLDELERRDPAGFAQWLRTEPRACGDPGRYLSADR